MSEMNMTLGWLPWGDKAFPFHGPANWGKAGGHRWKPEVQLIRNKFEKKKFTMVGRDCCTAYRNFLMGCVILTKSKTAPCHSNFYIMQCSKVLTLGQYKLLSALVLKADNSNLSQWCDQGLNSLMWHPTPAVAAITTQRICNQLGHMVDSAMLL